MVFSSFILIFLAASGASASSNNDIGPVLDDLIELMVPVMRANGDTEIDYEPLQGSAVLTESQVKEFFKLNQSVKKPKYLQNVSGPLKFTYNCTGGKGGDITTVKREGSANEVTSNAEDIVIGAQLTLKKMYVEYPTCKIKVNKDNRLDAKVIINVPSNTFTTIFLVAGRGKTCQTSVPLAYFTSTDFKTKTKAYVADIEDTFVEYLFDQLIKQNPIMAEIDADFGITYALDKALGSVDACRFLRRPQTPFIRKHANGYKIAHKKEYKPKNN